MNFGYPNLPLPRGCPWSSFQPPVIKYCEENLCALITAPANTWSNLVYLFVGFWLLKKFPKNQNGFLSIFAYAALVTGITSFLYHASYTFLFQIFDYVGMYFFSSLLLVFNLRRIKVISEKFIIPLSLLLIMISTLLFALSGGVYGRSIFGLQLAAVLVTELFIFIKIKESEMFINYKWLKISLLLFIVSYIAWWVDTGHFWCDPRNHFIQGHALWHVVNAFCFLTMANFYRQFKELY